MSADQPTATVPLDQPLYGATFGQAISRFFRKYAVFSGRASRSEYWFVVLFLALVGILIWVPGIVLGLATGTQTISSTTGRPTTEPGPIIIPFVIVGILFYLGTLVPGIAVNVRRLHDANLSGLLYLLVLIPNVGGLVVLVLSALQSNPQGARFDAGAAPYVPAGYVPAGSVSGAAAQPGTDVPPPAAPPATPPAVPPVPPAPPAPPQP